MANTAVYRTLSQNYGTGGGITTISFWFKRARTGTNEVLTSSYYSGSFYGQFQLGSNDKLTIQDWRNTNVYSKTTNMVFRDTSAWYHVCWSFNNRTGGSSSSNLWINGELITSWSSETEYSYQATTSWNTDYTHYIGCLNTSSSQAYFSGLIADYYFIQGQAYNVSLFGETDSTTGEWKPKTNPTIDYSGTGNNSCHLKFENSGNMDLDSGSNNLTFTTSGAGVTQTQDNPSNIFCAMDPLYNQSVGQGMTFTNSGTRTGYDPNSSRTAIGSMAVNKGKFYYECKMEATGGKAVVGFVDVYNWTDINQASGFAFQDFSTGIGYNTEDGNTITNNTGTSYGNTYAQDDIIGCAFDLDNGKIYFSKNGTWQNSGDPTSGSTGTGAANFTPASDGLYAPAARHRNGTYIQWNFGNGYFRTTAISSAGTNASNLGTFEYDVPNGYTALCTKGLNE